MSNDSEDERYWVAKDLIVNRKVIPNIIPLAKKMSISIFEASRIIDDLEEWEVISGLNGRGRRTVLQQPNVPKQTGEKE